VRTLGVDRRGLIAGGAAVSALALAPNHLLAQTPLDPAFAQPLLAQARRVIAALSQLGEPVAAADLAVIDRLETAGDLAGAAAAAAKLFDARTLLVVTVSPEARVSVVQGAAPPLLTQNGWRLFLVRIDNAALVPGRLDITSPEALPINNRYPDGHHHAAPEGGEDRSPVTAGAMAQRWLDIDVNNAPPLPAALDPLPVDWRVIGLYARDAGRRSARLYANIGVGTGDLGSRGYASIIFNALPAQTVSLSIRDHDGAPVTASLLIRDAQGHIYPAQTKRVLPDLYFQQRIYRADGQTLTLPPGEYSVETARGPEYIIQRTMRPVFNGRPSAWDIRLTRWIDPRKHGYYSGDHHIHASGCSHYQVPDAWI
jgi:hypothetical protein